MKIDIKEMDEFLVDLLSEIGDKLLIDSSKDKSVDTKSSRIDLVTNFDKSTEKLVVEKIKEKYSEAAIVSEEGYGDVVNNMSGLVFFVDPIDGTMNFVKRRDDFASMIGVYLDGKPFLGAIIDVVKKEIYHGGPDYGVFKNDEKVISPKNQSLPEGLVDISWPMVMADRFNSQAVVKKSSGLRIYGSAGIIFEHLIFGREVLYMSYLAPWDLAAGRVLCESLGLRVATIDDSPINMLKSQVVIVGTQKVISEVLKTVKK
ncbi:fructose-1 6-bisphosphatase [Companilactobacillus tucceti DSM 20183]|uniref:Fructose-1 6-bisphosphatase n=1 Tax=Companilactobacillus tucceti DSM 20183 TaxID=1423811 RepID=A0A0R1J207_9LACO|nr:inositol monophosphatase family protein [Companilactobacillus tucceti]KRK65408.1 fructose-1 6-bisphosphatase [Companilactobacillus tucceti DSM 20183]